MHGGPVVAGALLHQRIVFEAEQTGAKPVLPCAQLQAVIHIALRVRRRPHAAATQGTAPELIAIAPQQQVTTRQGIDVRAPQRLLRLGIGKQSAPLARVFESVLSHPDALRAQLGIDRQTQQHLPSWRPRHVVQGLLLIQYGRTEPRQFDWLNHGAQARHIRGGGPWGVIIEDVLHRAVVDTGPQSHQVGNFGGSVRSQRARCIQAQTQSREAASHGDGAVSRTSPSWAVLATSVPSRANTLARAKPRAPDALGLSTS